MQLGNEQNRASVRAEAARKMRHGRVFREKQEGTILHERFRDFTVRIRHCVTGRGGVGHRARIFNTINSLLSFLSLSLSLSLCLSIRGGQCRTRIMHALFGVALRRENQASPPSFASKSLATIFHDGSTTCCARGAEPVRALRCVRQTRT